jgi:hypothetical protein
METQSGENHKLIFINFCRHQAIVTNIVGTNILETPISLIEHQINKMYAPTYRGHQSPQLSTNSTRCRHQPTKDTNLLN